MRTSIYILIVFLAAGLVAGCSGTSSTDRDGKPAAYSVLSPLIADTAYVESYVAEVQSVQNVELRAQVSGYLEAVHVDEGKFVKRGQRLFSISSQQYQQELLKAQAAVASAVAETRAAEVELQRTRMLVEKKVVTQSEMDLMQAKVEALKAKANEAKAQESSVKLTLSFAYVEAPFDGYINRIPNKQGSLIEAGTLLTTLSNADEMFAYFHVPESAYLDIARSGTDKKQVVSLVLANNEVYDFDGVIETSESEIDQQTGNIAFRARFPNPRHLLKHGASGRVLLRKKLHRAMLIPQKSTFDIQGNLYVYVVTADNHVHQRQVFSDTRLPHLFVVSRGLSADERILYDGVQLVREGELITPKMVSFPSDQF